MMFNPFKNKGDRFESLIQYVYQNLSWASDREIEVLRNQKIIGKSGQEHQIDVYYEFEQNGIIHKVIIECKNHGRKVEKGMIQSFKAVLDDIGNAIGIFASNNGFQSGAVEFAKYYDIELVTGNEMPLIGKIAAMRIGVLLPDENVVGQPFWTLMECVDNELTGIYTLIQPETLGLFVSQKTAISVAKNIKNTVVRGVSQKHLKGIVTFAEFDKLKFACFFMDIESGGLILSVEDIKKYYII